MAASTADLSGNPHPHLHRLREVAPVVWVDDLEAWLVVSHDLCVDVMKDAATFTVDDPRFSTQQVIGPSMLSLDGPDHGRHRDPFRPPFRASPIGELTEFVADRAAKLVAAARDDPTADLRASVAGPLSVEVMARILDLGDVDSAQVLAWYTDIVEAVHAVTAGSDVPLSGVEAFAGLEEAVVGGAAQSALLGPIVDDESLTSREMVSNVAVLLFGGIVTTESSISIAYRYLLDDPNLASRVSSDRSLVPAFVEESFRLEPSAAAVDRYATRDVDIAGVRIAEGDLVRVSLTAANRDPGVFEDPDTLLMDRTNLRANLTFARGPHICLGIHLARLEVVAAVDALLDHMDGLTVGPMDPVEGLVFRAPDTVTVNW